MRTLSGAELIKYGESITGLELIQRRLGKKPCRNTPERSSEFNRHQESTTSSWSTPTSRSMAEGAGPASTESRSSDSNRASSYCGSHGSGAQSPPRSHGPVMAKVTPGVWILTKSHRPWGPPVKNVEPAHSKSV